MRRSRESQTKPEDMDWWFLDDPFIMARINEAASIHGNHVVGVEDLKAELAIWLACRPELKGRVPRVALIKKAKQLTELHGNRLHDSLDRLIEDGELSDL